MPCCSGRGYCGIRKKPSGTTGDGHIPSPYTAAAGGCITVFWFSEREYIRIRSRVPGWRGSRKAGGIAPRLGYNNFVISLAFCAQTGYNAGKSSHFHIEGVASALWRGFCSTSCCPAATGRLAELKERDSYTGSTQSVQGFRFFMKEAAGS